MSEGSDGHTLKLMTTSMLWSLASPGLRGRMVATSSIDDKTPWWIWLKEIVIAALGEAVILVSLRRVVIIWECKSDRVVHEPDIRTGRVVTSAGVGVVDVEGRT